MKKQITTKFTSPEFAIYIYSDGGIELHNHSADTLTFNDRDELLRLVEFVAQHDLSLKIVHVDGNPHVVARPVAQQIESLREDLARSLVLNDELREQSPAPPLLTTTHIGGAAYAVPVAVAQEIERLSNELARVRKGSTPRTGAEVAEMMKFLDELHDGLYHNMYRATEPLIYAFPELTRGEATLAVMCWMDRWNERHGEAQ